MDGMDLLRVCDVDSGANGAGKAAHPHCNSRTCLLWASSTFDIGLG